jgi:hypothetical protein
MSFTYLLEQEVESSADCFLGIPASVLSRLNLTAEKSCCNGSATDASRDSQSGTTCEHSTENRGEERSMSCAVGSHVRTSAVQDEARESLGNAADYGQKWTESFAKYDPSTRSWRIRQLWLFADLDESLGIWPKQGWMQNGECSEHRMLADIAMGNDSGLLPRPQRVDGQKWYVVNQSSARKRVKDGRQLMLIHVVGLTAYEHLSRWLANPPFWEAMMGWPIGWTACTPLGTVRFQEWRLSHGEP